MNILRKLHEADAKNLVELTQQESLRIYTTIPRINSQEQAYSYIEKSNQDFIQGTKYRFAIQDPETGLLIGVLSLYNIKGTNIERGYWIHPDKQGKGYAQQAHKECLEFLRQKGFTTLEARIRPENQISTHLLEKYDFKLIADYTKQYTENRKQQGRLLYKLQI